MGGDALRDALQAGGRVRLALRLRADMFRGAASAPPEVNVYVTRPKVVINGEEVDAEWRFASGNAFESLWLESSEGARRLFAERRGRSGETVILPEG